jgi:two-component system, cell cycle response regulator
MRNKPKAEYQADILVVDDEPENLHVLSHMLHLFGYRVRAVSEGAMALSVAQATPPDLIMLDISMPGMDGYETCERLKADDRTRDIPVIFISALVDVQDKVKAFDVGGVDYVPKPFQIEEVLARLETHLSMRRLQIQLENANRQLEEANRDLANRLRELSDTQAAEREQRRLAESLRDTIIDINSTLDSNEVLELILKHLARIVPHDAAYIALPNGDGNIHVRRALGYKERGLEEQLLALHVPIDFFPVWGRVYKSSEPLAISDTRVDSIWSNLPELNWVRSSACTPILTKGEFVGFLNLDSATPGFFTSAQLERLRTFADYAALAIEKARLFEKTQNLAITDELTGLLNRRQVLKLAEVEYERVRRYRRPLSAVMIDIDHFKRINDTFGHPVGDQALIALANCCRANLRTVDILGRYGGEEFLILLPETQHNKALEAADRIRKQVEAMVLPASKGPLKLTISAGVATLDLEAPVPLDELVKNADDALYGAKAAGRNRVQGEVRPDSP